MNQTNEPVAEFTVGEYWRSSDPTKKCLVISVGKENIASDEKHHSFIRRIYSNDPNTVTIPTSEYEKLKADAERLDRNRILLNDRDEFGEPFFREIIGINLREAIDQAKESA